MSDDQIVLLIREIFLGLGVLGGFLATIFAGISGLKKLVIDKNKLAIDKRNSEIANKKDEVELTDKLQKISADLLSKMDDRIKVLETKLEEAEEQVTVLRNASLKLIEGIEASMRARSQTQLTGNHNCAACLSGDAALYHEVVQLRQLLERQGNNVRSNSNG